MEDERKSSIDTLSTTASAANTLRGAIKQEKLLMELLRDLQLVVHMAQSLPDCGRKERQL
ncbi:hypothetical protein DW841_25405 [Hungatella hathewayi]|nr:hypothetical protein DW841_25405 [Hungatella hathewayi]